MDFLPDYEFHEIFDRVSKKVDLQGANSPKEVNRRLNRKIKEYPPSARARASSLRTSQENEKAKDNTSTRP